jgi:3-oxoadipate enol-lactonase
VRLGYRLDGPEDAPVVVLAAALGTTFAIWEPLLPRLAAGHRVLRHDLPGHGTSPQPEEPLTVAAIGEAVVSLLDGLGVERVAFCGLSVGGMVGMWLGAEAPDRITRLVLACTGASLGEPSQYAERAALVRAYGMRPVLDGARERWFTPDFRDSLAARRVLAQLRDMPPEGYAACCEAVGAFDVHDRLGDVAPPALVLHAEQDPMTPPPVVDALLTGLPDATEATIDDASHLANVEQPNAFAAAVLDHIEERSVA